MIGNIWLSSAVIITAIISSSAIYKSYNDIQEAKQIQEHYEIVSDIKTLLAKQYNKSPKEITRDEIIVHLPRGGNWDKILLLDRNQDSTLTNKELINRDGNLIISENEKVKLLALKAKLKNLTDMTNIVETDGKYTFHIGKKQQNTKVKEKEIMTSVTNAIDHLSTQVLYVATSLTSTQIDAVLNTTLEDFTPYNSFYQDFGNITDENELKNKKKELFKNRIKEELEQNKNAMDTKLYYHLKEKL